MTQARIEPAVADDESAQPTALPQPYAYDSEALRKKLADARDEGIKRLRRIQRPTIALGFLILLANAIVPYGVGRARQLAVNISITSFGAYILALAITPLQPRSISAITFLLGFLLFVAAGLQVRSVAGSALILVYGCKAALNIKATCQYNLLLIIFRSIGATVDLFFCVLLFRGLCRRMSSFQRYEAIWKAFGMTFVLRGAIAIVAFSALRLWLNDRATSTAGSSEAGGMGLFITGVLAMNKRLRLWVHSQLASIGAEVSAAVSISTMFAAVGRNEDVLARTQETLCAVSAADVRASAFLNVDPAAPNVSVTARLGQIDAFISHSWSDDPNSRFHAFQLWRAEFKRLNNREPMVWLDKYCLPGQDQNALAESLPNLPVFISACREFVLLRGPTVLGRMWCLIEIFIWTVMRETTDGITVIPFDQAPSLEGVEATPEDASAFDVFVMRADGRFDARRAVCVFQADYLLLSAVMDAYPGGIDQFNRALLTALVHGEARWEKRLMSDGGTGSRRGRVEPVERQQSAHSRVAIVPTDSRPTARDPHTTSPGPFSMLFSSFSRRPD